MVHAAEIAKKRTVAFLLNFLLCPAKAVFFNTRLLSIYLVRYRTTQIYTAKKKKNCFQGCSLMEKVETQVFPTEWISHDKVHWHYKYNKINKTRQQWIRRHKQYWHRCNLTLSKQDLSLFGKNVRKFVEEYCTSVRRMDNNLAN